MDFQRSIDGGDSLADAGQPRVGFNAPVIGEDQRESAFFKSRDETGELRPNEFGVSRIVFEVQNQKRFLQE